MGWGTSSTSSPTTLASWARTMPGGWTSSKTARPLSTRNTSISTGCPPTRSSPTRCWFRCWGIPTESFSSAVRSSCDSSRSAAPSPCSITSIGFRWTPEPIRGFSTVPSRTFPTSSSRTCDGPSDSLPIDWNPPASRSRNANATRSSTNAASPHCVQATRRSPKPLRQPFGASPGTRRSP